MISEEVAAFTKIIVCKNPKNFLSYLECNKEAIIILGVCIFLFFLGIAILLKSKEIVNKEQENLKKED